MGAASLGRNKRLSVEGAEPRAHRAFLVEGPRPSQQCFFVLLAPRTNGLKLVAGSLATRQQFKSK